MAFTVNELTAAISEWEEELGLDEDLFMMLWNEGSYDDHALPTLPNIGKLELVDSWGGEGDGAEIHVVIKAGDRYFQRDGYYSSWGESDMDGELYEVKPKQVLRTEYEAI